MEGVRVLEVAQYTFTPAAGAVMADWGADVIKVEHAVTGDAQRGIKLGTGGAAADASSPDGADTGGTGAAEGTGATGAVGAVGSAGASVDGTGLDGEPKAAPSSRADDSSVSVDASGGALSASPATSASPLTQMPYTLGQRVRIGGLDRSNGRIPVSQRCFLLPLQVLRAQNK